MPKVPHLESLPAASLQLTRICLDCEHELTWDHIGIAEEGDFLDGHCGCAGRRHQYALGPTDRVLDAQGRAL